MKVKVNNGVGLKRRCNGKRENIGHRREARNRNSCQVDSGYKREDNGEEDLGEERGGQEVLLED